MQVPHPPGQGIDRLLALMAQLRDKSTGCPWDLEQNFATIAPYTIEEAYEVAEAIETGDPAQIKDELGDLLFQTVFHGRIAEELGLFNFADIADAVTEKMIRRHPHVFGEAGPRSASEQTQSWEVLKASERAAKTKTGPVSALDGVTAALPALTRAVKIQTRASRQGFDWTEIPPILDKINEEIAELRAEIEAGSGADRLEDELGDVLFSVANLARHLKLDAEGALRRATLKFETRFRRIEAQLAAEGTEFATQDAAGLDALWREAKAEGGLPRPGINPSPA